MSFRLLFFKGRLGIFWVVQAGALAATLILAYIFRKEKQEVKPLGRTEVKRLFSIISSFRNDSIAYTASFFPNMPRTINGIICVSVFA